MDRGSLRWFVVGLCGGSVSGFCNLILVRVLISVVLIDFGGFLIWVVLAHSQMQEIVGV